LILPKEAYEPGGEPDSERGPEVRPGVHGVGGVPEQKTEVGDAEDDVRRIEGFVEAVADVG
jgi:hypothetical protein